MSPLKWKISDLRSWLWMCCLLSAGTSSALAADVQTRILWQEGKPAAEVTLDKLEPGERTEITIPLELFDPLQKSLWKTVLKVPLTGAAPYKASVPLEKITEPAKQHRLDAALRDAGLGIDYRELVYFSDPAQQVQTYGFRFYGLYPARKAEFVLGLNGFKGEELRELPVTITLRDGDDNVIQDRTAGVQPAAKPVLHRLDITPDVTVGLGPYTAEIGIDSEGYGVSFQTDYRFSQAGSLVPVSGFEHGDISQWFAADTPLNFQSLQMYYSPQFTALKPFDYPKMSFDLAEKHSGREALRVDYQARRPGVVWGMQDLPGRPTMLAVWVKGNGTQDELLVHFEDRINYTLPAWQRNANFSNEVVCQLSSTEWKRFRVPVLGDGQQASGIKGSTVDVDGPVRILGFSIRPSGAKEGPEAGQPLSFWIDDLAVETQALPAQRLTVELETNAVNGLLTSDTKLMVSVGSGFDVPLARGKLSLIARDIEGQTVYDTRQDLVVPPGEFALATFALEELAKRNPRGPVEIDVTFLDAGQAGARVSKRFTFKSPHQGGIFHDFEEPNTFSSYQPGKVGPSVAKIIAGGVDPAGKDQPAGHALSLPVLPIPAGSTVDNSVLLHPALPGIVDRVELMLYGDGKPVIVQPWFIDSGFTGMWLRNQNIFWPDPIRVDWQGWKKVTITAPATPAHHGDKNFYFLYKPWYPLNLALSAKLAEGEAPAEIRLDNVRVVTHLPAAEEVRLEVEYPSEARIHQPGSKLNAMLWNYSSEPRELRLYWELNDLQGLNVQQGDMLVSLPPGAKQRSELSPQLPAGVYELLIKGLGEKPVTSPVLVLDEAKYFGADPLATLVDPVRLRELLGQMTENIYLDWDNTEGAPYMFHYGWFYDELRNRQKTAANLPEVIAESKALDAAQAKVTEATGEVGKVQGPLSQILQQLSQMLPKVEQKRAMLPEAEALLKSTTETYNTAKTKFDDATKLAEAAKKKEDDTKAAQVKADTDFKAAEKAVPEAEKVAADVKKAFEEADKVAKAAEEAATKAQEVATASAKAAEDAKKASEGDANNEDLKKAAAEAQTKAEADAKTAETAAKAATDALAVAKEKQTALDVANAAVVTAKDVLVKATAALKTAKEAAETATKELAEANKLAGDAKAAVAAPEKAKNEAQAKLTGLQGQIDGEQTAVTQKQTERDAAQKAVTAAQQVLTDARTAQAAADKAYQEKLAKYGFKMLPVVGFSADWAGPEAAETIRNGTYSRYIPNLLQIPRRLNDWSQFVRELMREYHGRFEAWVFWENPDLDDAPQSIPPERYASLLSAFHRWVKLYQPEAKVIAGGFNFTKMLEYLDRIEDPAKLQFDEISVQMNLGELSPEQADLEGFLDELNETLQIRETNRLVRIQELDWGIAEYLTPGQQAAYHARAALILDSRGATPHQFNLINTGFEFQGYGVFYRLAYGNAPELQAYLPYHVPKPAYFALIETRKFLAEWDYVTSVQLADRSLQDNRAFVYQNSKQELTAVLWRAVTQPREYLLPAAWQGATAHDTFGFPLKLEQKLRLAPLPVFIHLPAGYKLEALLHDLRTLPATDGSYPVLVDLHLSEPDSVARASYASSGQTTPVVYAGTLPGGRKLREKFLTGLESEKFRFQVATAGDVLLRRRWYFDGQGNQLAVKVNDAAPVAWDLSAGQDNTPGVRESTLLLRGCPAGENAIEITYDKPGNASGYRLEPVTGDALPLVRWGAINSRQTVGEYLNYTSVVGTPLRIGGQSFEQGLGTHATSFIEYPLAGQFDALEVTVGIDGSTEGRGSVIFRVFVDGKERANSKLITGFSKPLTLKVDGLAGAKRMILSVMDAGDGDKQDLANWVDGKLILKKQP